MRLQSSGSTVPCIYSCTEHRGRPADFLGRLPAAVGECALRSFGGIRLLLRHMKIECKLAKQVSLCRGFPRGLAANQDARIKRQEYARAAILGKRRLAR
jgi:hypothetical protein